jgi:hypothetical protein
MGAADAVRLAARNARSPLRWIPERKREYFKITGDDTPRL